MSFGSCVDCEPGTENLALIPFTTTSISSVLVTCIVPLDFKITASDDNSAAVEALPRIALSVAPTAATALLVEIPVNSAASPPTAVIAILELSPVDPAAKLNFPSSKVILAPYLGEALPAKALLIATVNLVANSAPVKVVAPASAPKSAAESETAWLVPSISKVKEIVEFCGMSISLSVASQPIPAAVTGTVVVNDAGSEG